MTLPKTYREWWIDHEESLVCTQLEPDYPELVHVIEHRVLKDAETEIERLNAHLKIAMECLYDANEVMRGAKDNLDRTIRSVVVEIERDWIRPTEDKQSALLDKAVAALELIINEHSHYVGSLERGHAIRHPFHGVFETIARTAKQALEEIAKGRKE